MSAVAHIDQYKEGAFFQDAFRGKLSWNGYENNVLLQNLGSSASAKEGLVLPDFVDVGVATGADTGGDARGLAILDFDNDGDLDLAINHNPGDHSTSQNGAPAVLLENKLGQKRNWVALKLVGKRSNRDAVGAKVSFKANSKTYWAEVRAGSGYAGQSQRRLHFGLDDYESPLKVEVQWPSGARDLFYQVPINTMTRLVEGEGGVDQ